MAQGPYELLPPAPGSDRHPALHLANSRVTLPAGRVFDALQTSDAATAWLIELGLASESHTLQEYCRSRLIELRRHVRELLRARTTSERPDPLAVEAVNDAMRLTPIAQPLAWDAEQGLYRTAAHPVTLIVEHALAEIAADAAALLTGPDADRLAACQAPSCSRFLVRTHARRHWCSTRCGDRVRAARAYARRAA